MTATVHSRYYSRCTLLSVFDFRTLTLHNYTIDFYCYGCTFYFIMFVTWTYVFAFTNIVYV